MRVVTQGAVFLHRRMFPQERAALFGMAGVAGFGDGVFLQLEIAGRPMWIMTVCAYHFGFPKWMPRTLKTLRFLFGVTLKADFGLRGFFDDRVTDGMNGMTSSAGDIR